MRLLRSIPWPDSKTILGVTLVGGTLATLVFVFFGSLFAGLSAGIWSLLYVFAVLLPLVGVGLIGAGVYWFVWNRETDDSDKLTLTVPERGTTAARNQVGKDQELWLSTAASNRYRCRQHSSGQDIESTLREGAIRRVRTRDGHDYETARSIVAAGDWTDDPIAAAFLSQQTAYPLLERFRAAIDPGKAYWRRVDRTLAVIEGTGEADGDSRPTAQEVHA